MPAFWSFRSASRNEQASLVQPGVSARGWKYSTTVLPLKSFRETSFPFSSSKVMSGALSLTSSMASSPIRPSLYRSTCWAVICGLLAVVLVQVATAQLARKGKEKSPRALGLLQLAPDGKARLIPIAIMIDGKFYDASAYKASPVPLALWSGTVYEADSNGVSQGLFTVGGAVRAGTNWFGDGKWQPAGSAPPKPRDTNTKPVLDPDEGPPKLRRPE